MSKVLITSFSLVHSSLLHCFGTDKRGASHNPPGGLTAEQVPMFVSFGFDDNSSPGEACTAEMDFGHKPYVGKHPGLWELPSYAVIVPPDELCKKYGVKKGFRDRMFKEQSYFNTNDGKVTGLDWNLWFEWYMTKAEFLATLKYTLDLRLEGNRCPLFFGVHSDIYSSKYEENDIEEGTQVNATVQERGAALKEFLEYALTKPQVRVTSMKNILNWLKNPLAL